MFKARVPTLEQLDSWIARGKNKRAQYAIEALPEAQQNPEMKLRLAQAIVNDADAGDLEGRKMLRRGLEVLQSIEPKEATLQNRFAFQYALGFTWHLLDHPVEALPYFKKAHQLDPSNQAAQKLLQWCQQAAQRPKARWPFRAGVQKAWEAFEEQQPAILKQLEAEKKGRCNKKLERMVSDVLEPALLKPECSVWKTDRKPVLVCNASASIAMLAAVLHFFQQAPATVREVWEFRIGPLPDQKSAPVRTFLRQYGDQIIPLFCKGSEICGAKLMDIPVADFVRGSVQDPGTERLFVNLRSFLGYVPFLHLQTSVARNSRPPISVPLRELPQILTATGADCSEDSAEAVLEMHPYRTRGDVLYKFWREGDETGIARTAQPAVLTPEQRLKTFDNDTVQDGIEGGYLVWEIKDGFKKSVQDKTAQLQEQIQSRILEQLGDAYYYPMGRATDFYFAYLDFIAWDLQPVLETAADLLQTAGIPWAVYRPYRDCDPAISLYGFDAPPLQRQS